jgi:hypothetical protein
MSYVSAANCITTPNSCTSNVNVNNQQTYCSVGYKPSGADMRQACADLSTTSSSYSFTPSTWLGIESSSLSQTYTGPQTCNNFASAVKACLIPGKSPGNDQYTVALKVDNYYVKIL